MLTSSEQVDQYLDSIERDTLGGATRQRQEKLDELNSIDQMAVEALVSGYIVAANQTAYLRALCMALVRAGRRQQCMTLSLD